MISEKRNKGPSLRTYSLVRKMGATLIKIRDRNTVTIDMQGWIFIYFNPAKVSIEFSLSVVLVENHLPSKLS